MHIFVRTICATMEVDRVHTKSMKSMSEMDPSDTSAAEVEVMDGPTEVPPDVIVEHVCSRAGLLGNPSDMYHGEVISFALANFYATVRASFAKETLS